MATMREVQDTISRLHQQAHDLYWDRDEDGQMRTLHPCEEKLLERFRAIDERFDNYLVTAEAMHGASALYRMISECANRQRAIELQRAWRDMAVTREEAGI
jgi:hypothetical protein